MDLTKTCAKEAAFAGLVHFKIEGGLLPSTDKAAKK
jgi:hypothetical protein